MKYSKEFEVRWADLDPNWHLKNTAYEDYAGHVRISYLHENGFPISKYQELQFGPVVFSEKLEYFKEISAGQKFTVNYRMMAMSKDGRKWRLQHQVIREDGKEAARITVEGSWLDLTTRKLRQPPPELYQLMDQLEKTEDYQEL